MRDPTFSHMIHVFFPVTEVQTLLAGLSHAMLPIRGKYGESSDIQVSRMDRNWSKFLFLPWNVYIYMSIVCIYIYIQMLMCIYSKQLKFVSLSFDLPKNMCGTLGIGDHDPLR